MSDAPLALARVQRHPRVSHPLRGYGWDGDSTSRIIVAREGWGCVRVEMVAQVSEPVGHAAGLSACTVTVICASTGRAGVALVSSDTGGVLVSV